MLGFLFTINFDALAAWPFSSSTSTTTKDTSKYQSEATRKAIEAREAKKTTPSTQTTTSTTKSSQAAAPTLANKTITMTNKTKKDLVIKSGTRDYTIAPNQTKKFNFESIQKAGVGYMGSFAPYRPLDLASVALNLMRRNEKNVNVNLVPGTIWSAKIADATYAAPTPGAITA